MLSINPIGAVIAVIAVGILTLKAKRDKKQERNSSEEKSPKWYPTGWYYDEEKETWIAPDYKAEENERYQIYRQGKEPTYEEWKAAKAEKNKE